MYDNNGDAFGFKYNGTEYFYVKNLQNDITAITDSAGKVIANYYYDAWGNITSTTGNTTIANANPLRYRSYYYDTDTKLYYLNTRYYSPDMFRFLNADNDIVPTVDITTLTDKNLFAYCDNNPVIRADNCGEFWHIVVGAAVGAVIGAASSILTDVISGEDIDWKSAGISALSGGISGALASTGIGLGWSIAINAALSSGESVLTQGINSGFKNINYAEVALDGVVGGVTAAVGGKGKGTKHLNNLGKQTVKRTVNAATHKGTKAAVKEAGKAFTYYAKSTKNSFYKPFFKGIWKDIAIETFNPYAMDCLVAPLMYGGPKR